jgi:hypothetical protein
MMRLCDRVSSTTSEYCPTHFNQFVPKKLYLGWETQQPITKGSISKQFLQQTCKIFLADQKEICSVVTFSLQIRKLVVRKALNIWPTPAEFGCVLRDPT